MIGDALPATPYDCVLLSDFGGNLEFGIRNAARAPSVTIFLVAFTIIAVAAKLGMSPGDTADQTCESYLASLDVAVKGQHLEGRFPRPELERYGSRQLKEAPIFATKNLGASQAYLACDRSGHLLSLGLTSTDEEFNKFAALVIAALASVSSDDEASNLGQRFFNLYKQAESTLRGDGPGTGTSTFSGYVAKMTLLPSRDLRLELAAPQQPLMFASEALGTDPALVARPVDAKGWRCDPSDPDGRQGMGNFTGKADAMPPRLPAGQCIVLAQPHHLYRAPEPLLGRTIEMHRMGCYRHDEGEYRCIPYMAHKRNADADRVIIRSADISNRNAMDHSCPTLRRGLESSECKFTIRFKELEFGTDHTETVRWIRTDSILIVPE